MFYRRDEIIFTKFFKSAFRFIVNGLAALNKYYHQNSRRTCLYLPALKSLKMKVLSEDRTRILFEKLTKYIGVNVKLLIDRPDGTYCFREKKDRVYYISERLLQLAQTVKPDHLVSAGTCFGKFTKTNKFRLHITALTYIAPYAPFKIWVKPSAEQQFLYGHNIIKSGLGRITENTPKHQGVVVNTMSDIPIGFGVASRTTAECRHADPLATIVFHQADIGEYIRSEDTLT